MPAKIKARAAYLVHWEDGTVLALSENGDQLGHNFKGTFTPEQFTGKIKEWRRTGMLNAFCRVRRGAPLDMDKWEPIGRI